MSNCFFPKDGNTALLNLASALKRDFFMSYNLGSFLTSFIGLISTSSLIIPILMVSIGSVLDHSMLLRCPL